MANITIQIGSHDGDMTVSDMRKRLAKVLSKLRGDQPVTFSFGASLQNYKPEPRVTQTGRWASDGSTIADKGND